MILVDSNVLIDVFGEDDVWFDWSLGRLDQAALAGPVLINDIIYAESSIRFQIRDNFDAALNDGGIVLIPIPRQALFIAGKAHSRYRAAGGARTGVLPDFFIGAHAAVLGIPLLTRDTRRYRQYFPTIELIAP